MNLQDILAVKGSSVFGTTPEATLAEAVADLVERHVGALLVFREEGPEERQLAGIVTERDILYYCARGKVELRRSKVAEVMTTTLITAAPEDTVEQVLTLMTARRIRHVPVLVEGRLLGIVSIGDLVKAQTDQLAIENRFLKDYIHG
jgi:CBS domain-containing protein